MGRETFGEFGSFPENPSGTPIMPPSEEVDLPSQLDEEVASESEPEAEIVFFEHVKLIEAFVAITVLRNLDTQTIDFNAMRWGVNLISYRIFVQLIDEENFNLLGVTMVERIANAQELRNIFLRYLILFLNRGELFDQFPGLDQKSLIYYISALNKFIRELKREAKEENQDE